MKKPKASSSRSPISNPERKPTTVTPRDRREGVLVVARETEDVADFQWRLADGRWTRLLEGALALADQGERVVILHGIDSDGQCTCKGKTKKCHAGKHPRFVNYIERATSDPKELHELLERYPVSNTGRVIHDDEMILDVDKPSIFAEVEKTLGPLPKAPTVLTGTGGGRQHVSLKRPSGRIVIEHDWGEVKVSGYVVTPSSVTTEPYCYAAGLSFKDVERPDCPPKWCDMLIRKPVGAVEDQAGTRREWTGDLGQHLLAKALEASELEQRHPACKNLVLQLRDNRAPYAKANEIVENFADAVEHDGDHPFERAEAVQILDSIYQTPPREPWAAAPKNNPPVPEPDPDVKSISFWELVNEEPDEEQSLLGEGILVRDSINVLAGEGGVGKTTLACQIGLCLAAKTSFLNMDVNEAVPVLYLLAEGNRFKFAERLKNAADFLGINLKGLPIFGLNRKQPIPQIGSPALVRLIEDTKAAVVFLDTHGFFHTGEDNSRTDWKNLVVKPLRGLHLLSEPAFVLLDHLTKENLRIRKNNQRLGPRIVGAGNKRDDSDSVFILHWPNGELDPLRVLYFDKMRNREPKEPLDLLFDLPTGTFSIRPPSLSKVLSLQEERLRVVRETVTRNMPTAQIKKTLKRQLPLGESAIEKLLKRACEEKVIRQGKKGEYGPNTDGEE